MTRVVADISMSLDAFVTGPDPDLEHGLGRGGRAAPHVGDGRQRRRRRGPARCHRVLRCRRHGPAAVRLRGRPQGWNDDMGYGAGLAATPPFFVVTHSAPEQVRLGLRFTFVTDGLEPAIAQARDAAGGKDVFVMGGADVVRQCLDAGLADELRIHLAPIVLGAGPCWRAPPGTSSCSARSWCRRTPPT